MPSRDFTNEDLFSSRMMSMQSSTHSSQMKTVGPAISLRTSCWLLPQNEQYKVFFESLPPILLISEVAPAETLVHPTAHQAFPRRSSTDRCCPSKTCRLYVNLTTHSWPNGELIFQLLLCFMSRLPR